MKISRLPKVLMVALLLMGAGVVPLHADEVVLPEADAFDAVARDLTKGLDLHRAARVAVWPLAVELSPLTEAVLDRLNAGMVAALHRLADGRFSVLDRSALGAVMREVQETGRLDDAAGNPMAALLDEASGVDGLIVGELRLQGVEAELRYRAVRLDTRIIAVADPVRIRLSSLDADPLKPEWTLDQAIEQAAAALVEAAPEMEGLKPGGIRFAGSGAQPAFGRYVEGRLIESLTRAFHNPITERKLVVHRPGLADAVLDRLTGERVDGRQLRVGAETLDPDVFTLEGRYWLMGPSIDLRLRLRSGDGREVGWWGRIDPAGIGGLALEPTVDIAWNPAPFGPVGLLLTTDRGNDPRYRIGENLDLLVRLDRDGWLYCFYHQADGQTMQIFPNPYFWRDYREPRLDGARLFRLPGAEVFPFDLTFAEPVGVEAVRCFAAAKDITQALPAGLQGRSLAPIPKAYAGQLSRLFNAAAAGAVTEAAITLTVTDGD